MGNVRSLTWIVAVLVALPACRFQLASQFQKSAEQAPQVSTETKANAAIRFEAGKCVEGCDRLVPPEHDSAAPSLKAAPAGSSESGSTSGVIGNLKLVATPDGVGANTSTAPGGSITTFSALQAAIAANQNVTLGASITWPVERFAPLTDTYSGSFNGNGYTLTGVQVVETSGSANLGMVRVLTGTIRNLEIRDALVGGIVDTAGMVAGRNQGTIEDVRVASGLVMARAVVGGVAGRNQGTIQRSEFHGYVESLSVKVSSTYPKTSDPRNFHAFYPINYAQCPASASCSMRHIVSGGVAGVTVSNTPATALAGSYSCMGNYMPAGCSGVVDIWSHGRSFVVPTGAAPGSLNSSTYKDPFIVRDAEEAARDTACVNMMDVIGGGLFGGLYVSGANLYIGGAPDQRDFLIHFFNSERPATERATWLSSSASFPGIVVGGISGVNEGAILSSFSSGQRTAFHYLNGHEFGVDPSEPGASSFLQTLRGQ